MAFTVFDRIDPDHPLTVASREVNDRADGRLPDGSLPPGAPEPLEDVVEDMLGMGATPMQLAYLAQQRALRAVAARLFGVSDIDEEMARRVIGSDVWGSMQILLISCYLDGMAIGWRGRMIHDEREAVQRVPAVGSRVEGDAGVFYDDRPATGRVVSMRMAMEEGRAGVVIAGVEVDGEVGIAHVPLSCLRVTA